MARKGCRKQNSGFAEHLTPEKPTQNPLAVLNSLLLTLLLPTQRGKEETPPSHFQARDMESCLLWGVYRDLKAAGAHSHGTADLLHLLRRQREGKAGFSKSLTVIWGCRRTESIKTSPDNQSIIKSSVYISNTRFYGQPSSVRHICFSEQL